MLDELWASESEEEDNSWAAVEFIKIIEGIQRIQHFIMTLEKGVRAEKKELLGTLETLAVPAEQPTIKKIKD
eukprot:10122942-Karenia_brevis.AAC.1